MKHNQTYPTWPRQVSSAAVCSLAVMIGLSTSPAADKTWDGGGDGFSWSASPANWVGDVAPVANDSLFFDGLVGLYANNDFAAATAFTSITFNAGAGAFTLTGNEVSLAGGVTNVSANPQTISLNLTQTGNRTHYAVTNTTYDGVMKNNALIKRGAGTLTLAGSLGNSSLRAEVYDGVLALAKSVSSALGSSPIVVSDTGTLRIVGPATDQIHYNQRVVVTNGGVFQIQNTFEEIGALSGSNSLTGIVENGLAGTTNRLDIGGGNGHEGIYSGIIRDGAAGVLNLQEYRHDNKTVLNGTNTYTGTTAINNTSGTGTTRLIVNGQHTGGAAYTINGHNTTVDRLASLGGSGVISASVVNFNIRGILSPGGALSADMTDSATFSDTTAILTFNNNALNLNHATSTLDVQLNGATAGAGYDQVNIVGTGSFSNNAANLKLTVGYTPVVGDQFTIVKVQGTDPANDVGIFASLNGVAMDLSQGATFVEPLSGQTFRISYRAEGSTFDAGAGNGNDIMLQSVAPLYNQKLTWRGNGTDNNWDVMTTADWFNGTSLATFTNTDFVMFDNSGSNNLPLNLVGDLAPNFMTVNATQDYVFAGTGKLTGSINIVKTNTGSLTLVTDNDASGSMAIKWGTVQLGTNGTTGFMAGTITVNSNAVFVYNRSDDTTFTNTAFGGTGAFVHKGDGQLTLAADIPFAGRTTNSGGILQMGDGTTLFGSIAGDVNIPLGKNLVYKYANGEKYVYNSLSGSGTVDYDSSLGGTIRIATTPVSSNFTGIANLITGTRVWCSDGNNGYSLGNGNTVNVPDYCQVWLDRSATTYNQVFNIAGNGFAGDNPQLGALRVFGSTLNGQINLQANSRIGGTISGATILAPVKGDFQLEVLGNSDFQLSMGPTNATHSYSNTLVTRGWIRALNTNAISTGPLTLDVAGGLRLNGNNLIVASLSDTYTGVVTGDGAQVQNSHGSVGATLTVGTDNTSTTFNGVFGDGAAAPLGLTKVGAGTLTVSMANTNTGAVTVNGGTLALSGSGSFGNAVRIIVGSGAVYDVSLAGGTVTLNSGQTLGGSGTVNGSVTTSSGSTIAPGTSVGTLTVAGNVILGGAMLMELDRSLSPNCDRLVTSGGSITGGGTLTTTNIGPALQVNDTFQLFSGAVSGIAANPQTTDLLNGVTYTWQNDIALNGSIKVLTVNPIPAPTLGYSRTGNALTFSWTGPFKLQAQTNSLAVGVTNNWVTYPGGGPSPVTVTIDSANPTVFYRLSLQ